MNIYHDINQENEKIKEFAELVGGAVLTIKQTKL